jgi:hypothetical protein
MKKLKIFLSIGVLGLLSFTVEKFVTVKFTEEQINYHWQNLNATKQILSNSDLPHKQVVFIIQSIDSLQRNIQEQARIDSTSKK